VRVFKQGYLMFKRKNKQISDSARLPDFSYLNSDDIYMDSSCQSLRPLRVIEAVNQYYKTYGACGGRVKYRWGQKVDVVVEQTRDLVINYLGLSKKDYVCSFTQNTTYGLNLVLSQLPTGKYKRIITSEIEHNSVFLTTITQAKRLGVDRLVLPRLEDGSLDYKKSDLTNAIVVLNTTSNIDGRLLNNLKQLVEDTHNSGGIVILDAAQTVAHHQKLLNKSDADAICFSAHKTYAASLGAIIIKKSFLKTLDINFVGGGMVSSVKEQSFKLWTEDMSVWLEPGLQSYAEIISLGEAIKWLKDIKPGGMNKDTYLEKLSKKLFEGLSEIQGITMINKEPSSVISFYSDRVDSSRLATFLSAQGIMARSGYFCCHYYLLEKLKLPPMLRLSLGLHSTEDDVTKTVDAIKKIVEG